MHDCWPALQMEQSTSPCRCSSLKSPAKSELHILVEFLNNFLLWRYRGALGSLLLVATGFGLILSYCLGVSMQYNTMPWLFLTFPALHLVFSPYLFESPTCLLLQKKTQVSVEQPIELCVCTSPFTSFAAGTRVAHVLSWRNGNGRLLE